MIPPPARPVDARLRPSMDRRQGFAMACHVAGDGAPIARNGIAFQGGQGMPGFPIRSAGASIAAALLAVPASLSAATPPRASESFRIGSEGALCEAQGVMLGEPRASVFDRKWALLCADVERPIGTAFSWKGASEIGARVGRGREALLDCGEPVSAAEIVPGAEKRRCREQGS